MFAATEQKIAQASLAGFVKGILLSSLLQNC